MCAIFKQYYTYIILYIYYFANALTYCTFWLCNVWKIKACFRAERLASLWSPGCSPIGAPRCLCIYIYYNYIEYCYI